MKSEKIFRILLWPVATTSIYGIFRNVIYERVSPLLWTCLCIEEGTWLNFSTSILVLFVFFAGWSHKRNTYSSAHIGAYLSMLILIILFWFDNNSSPYLRAFGIIPIWPLLFGSYTLGLIVHGVYDMIPHVSQEHEFEHSDMLLFQDLPVERIDNDKLTYRELAKRIASSILEYKGNHSFSIGITGSWGSGKTTVLNFVKNYLLTNKDVITIDFSPRQSASIQDIQKDFLYELGRALAKYHSGAQRITEKYIRALGTLPDSLWAARVIGSFGTREVVEKRKEISNIINEINKIIVVFVDDFDRLAGEEIQEVLKLVDKNAAFIRTFFLSAYDKAHANGVIASFLGEIAGNRDYTDKYFNLEVSVPIRYSGRYLGILREHLYSLADNEIVGCTHEEIDSAVPRLFPFMTKYLSTVRDIKRFANLISMNLPPVEKDVALDDFLLTTLIRYKFPDEYVNLARHEYVALASDKKTFTLSIPNDKLKSEDILYALFSAKTAKRGYKTVTHQNSFDHYFYDYDARDLKFSELSKILDASITPIDFQRIVQPWTLDTRLKSDLIEFVLSYEKSIQSVADAKNYLRLFFLTRTYCESKDLYIASLSYLLEGNVEENVKTFKKQSDKEYKGFFKAALNDMFEWPLSVETLHDALHAVNTMKSGNVPKLVFTPDELMGFARKKVATAILHIAEGDVTNWDVYRVLKACVAEFIPDKPRELIDNVALEIVKEAIKEYPGFFFKDVLGHSRSGKQDSSIKLHFKEEFPYFDLFKSREEFQSFILSLSEITDPVLHNCLSCFSDYCVAQKTWEPILPVTGNIGDIIQSDYQMYNKLFEGEPVDA